MGLLSPASVGFVLFCMSFAPFSFFVYIIALNECSMHADCARERRRNAFSIGKQIKAKYCI